MQGKAQEIIDYFELIECTLDDADEEGVMHAAFTEASLASILLDRLGEAIAENTMLRAKLARYEEEMRSDAMLYIQRGESKCKSR